MANPYQVAIELAMASNHAQVLGALSHSLLGVFPQVTRLTQHFDRLKTAISGALGIAGVTRHRLKKLAPACRRPRLARIHLPRTQ